MPWKQLHNIQMWVKTLPWKFHRYQKQKWESTKTLAQNLQELRIHKEREDIFKVNAAFCTLVWHTRNDSHLSATLARPEWCPKQPHHHFRFQAPPLMCLLLILFSSAQPEDEITLKFQISHYTNSKDRFSPNPYSMNSSCKSPWVSSSKEPYLLCWAMGDQRCPSHASVIHSQVTIGGNISSANRSRLNVSKFCPHLSILNIPCLHTYNTLSEPCSSLSLSHVSRKLIPGNTFQCNAAVH